MCHELCAATKRILLRCPIVSVRSHYFAFSSAVTRPDPLSESVVTVWLSGNALALINVLALRRARLVLGWVPFAGMPSWYLTKPSRPTQSGHPSVNRRNQYWRWSRPPLGKKRRVLRNSRLCYQDCWHTGLVG